MNFLERSWLSIVRRPEKSLILFLAIFLIGLLLSGAILISKSVNKTLASLFDSVPVTVCTALDYESIVNDYQGNTFTGEYAIQPDFDLVSKEVLEQIGSSQYVKYYDYELQLCALMSDTYFRPTVLSDPFSDIPATTIFPIKNGRDPEIYDMKMGYIRLVSGRTFIQEEIDHGSNVMLISQEMADANKVGIGSVLDLYTKDADDEKKYYPVEIIGIFEPAFEVPNETDEDYPILTNMSNNFIDVLYLPEKLSAEIYNYMYGAEEKRYPELGAPRYNSYFVLNNLSDLDHFREETRDILKDHNMEYYLLNSTADKWDIIRTPMKSMGWIFTSVLWFALGAGALILSLMLLLSFRDRKKEIGIYLALGERKKKITGQMIAEVFAVFVLAITLSLLAGNGISGVLSDKILDLQVNSKIEQNNDRPDDIYGSATEGFDLYYAQEMFDLSDAQITEAMQSYQVHLDLSVILLFYICGFLLITISLLIPIWYTTHLNPKKMLM